MTPFFIFGRMRNPAQSGIRRIRGALRQCRSRTDFTGLHPIERYELSRNCTAPTIRHVTCPARDCSKHDETTPTRRDLSPRHHSTPHQTQPDRPHGTSVTASVRVVTARHRPHFTALNTTGRYVADLTSRCCTRSCVTSRHTATIHRPTSTEPNCTRLDNAPQHATGPTK